SRCAVWSTGRFTGYVRNGPEGGTLMSEPQAQYQARNLSLFCHSQDTAQVLNKVEALLKEKEVLFIPLWSSTTSKERRGMIILEYSQRIFPLDVLQALR